MRYCVIIGVVIGYILYTVQGQVLGAPFLPIPPPPPGVTTTTTRNPDGSTTTTTISNAANGLLSNLGNILGLDPNNPVPPATNTGIVPPSRNPTTTTNSNSELEECPDDGKNDQYICLIDSTPTQAMMPTSNGCGPAIFGDLSELSTNLLPSDFNVCCQEHDVCYGTCGRTRLECDAQFSTCLTTALRQQTGAGLLLLAPFPALMSAAVTRFGCTFFGASQRENCHCQLDGSPPFPAVPPAVNTIASSGATGTGIAGSFGAITNPGAITGAGTAANAAPVTNFPQLPPLSETA